MAHTWRARDRASRALNLDLSKLSQDFRFYFDSILFFQSFTAISVYGRNKSNNLDIQGPFDKF